MKKYISSLFVLVICITLALALPHRLVDANTTDLAEIVSRKNLGSGQFDSSFDVIWLGLETNALNKPTNQDRARSSLTTPKSDVGKQPEDFPTIFSCDIVTDVPASECLALVDLYESTNGTGWVDNTNWLASSTAGNWFGVVVTDGHVAELSLTSNQLGGMIPTSIGDLVELESLNLGLNQLSGTIPPSIGDLVKLKVLNFAFNQLSGSIPTSIAQLKNLETLWLDRNQLTGAIPTGIGELGELVSLNLAVNQLSGEIPSTLYDLVNLTFLWLNNNKLTGAIPTDIQQLALLTRLSLSTNDFNGSIPESITKLTNLEYLNLANNGLTGNIPASLGELSSTKNLFLHNNELSGTIPASISDLAQLERLYLTGNNLSGEIPANIGELHQLRELNLCVNQLSGSIPNALSRLENLEKLQLDRNQLSGEIPSGLGDLVSLKELLLFSNPLTGPIPVTFTNLTQLETFFFFNTSLCEPETTAFLAWKSGVSDWQGTGVLCSDLGPLQVFDDVPDTHWAYDWIGRLYNAGVTSGCSQIPPLYCPYQSVTRAEMAKFLLKGVHGGEYVAPPVGTSTGFDDVSTSYWAATWIKQLGVEGITSGCGGGNYCPNDNVTRAEMAKFLLTAKHGAGYTPPAVDEGTGFNDVPDSYWAAAWIKQLAAEGITSGCGGGNYCPDDDVTRAEMAKFLVLTFALP